MDDYLIDADRSTLRLSTGYPIETYLLKKSSRRQTGELCSNLPKISIPPQKIKIDNIARFRYPDDYYLY